MTGSSPSWMSKWAHDLRGPLAPIQSALFLLRHGGNDVNERDELFELIDRAPFPYLILSPGGAIVHANRAAVLLLGDQISAVHRLQLIAFVPRADQAIYLQWLYRARFEPQTLLLTLIPFGTDVEVRLISDFARIDGAVFILVAIEDLRELRRAERRLGTMRDHTLR